MLDTITLSPSAVAVLRFEIKGWRPKNLERRQPAYRELAAAGIMEPVPDSELDYRFTDVGMREREEILERESERIERERLAPPSGEFSDAAKILLHRVVSSDRIEIDASNRSLFRELAADRVLTLGHSFAKGEESGYRWTYWGWHRRFELAGMACAKEAV